MVMQSGEDPAGGKDSKSAKPLPWKYIALAAIVAAAILGIFFAATTGIFSGPVSIADTTTTSTSGSGFSPPAETDSGSLAVTDKEDNKKSTKAARIPSPNEIMPTGTLISISNPQKFVKANSNLVITEIAIDKNNNRIEASYLNIDTKESIVRPASINFFNEDKNNIFREQYCCKYYGNNDQAETIFGNGYAHCQWPEDFCFISTAQKNGKGWKIWEKYWEEKLGKKQQPQKVGSTEYKEIVPTIKANGKYKFAVSCEIPSNAKYIKIT